MAKTKTVTKTKTATKEANTKTKPVKERKAKTNADGTEKQKRAPTAYNIFVGEHIKKWKADHPEEPHRNGMAAVAVMWATAEENPNRGKPVVKKTPKAPKGAKEPKKAAAKSKSKKDPEPEEEEDDDDEDEKENELQTSDD
ncbi:hypothetical protein FB451DRAFT_646712 [Mycena latifolia]|nr:hypothetical protein FB451DRAFT_646712 [Mycena latifolia]